VKNTSDDTKYIPFFPINLTVSNNGDYMRLLSTTLILTVIFCGLVFSQSSKPFHSVSRSFGIPFQIQPQSDDPIRVVELLFSRDNGRTWQVFNRFRPDETNVKFVAPTDGEYWFSFRTTSASGKVQPRGTTITPQLHVLVGKYALGRDTQSQYAQTPQAPSTVTPPKPVRDTTKKERQTLRDVETVTNDNNDSENVSENETVGLANTSNSKRVTVSKPLLVPLIPKPVRTQPTIQSNTNVNTQPHSQVQPQTQPQGQLPSLESLIKDVDQLFDKREPSNDSSDDAKLVFEPEKKSMPPYTAKSVTDNVSTTSPQSQPPQPVAKQPQLPGRISKISMQNEDGKAKIFVQWIVTNAFPTATTRVDILRGSTYEGPWEPIVREIENSGEYWWQITTKDLTPFYIAVRLQSSDGRFAFDVTRTPIKIAPAMLAK
jgi:hypothetical protein